MNIDPSKGQPITNTYGLQSASIRPYDKSSQDKSNVKNDNFKENMQQIAKLALSPPSMLRGSAVDNKDEVINEHKGTSKFEQVVRDVPLQARKAIGKLRDKMKTDAGKAKNALVSSDLSVAQAISKLAEGILTGIARGF